MIPSFLHPERVPFASITIVRAPQPVTLPVTSITIVPVRPAPLKVVCAWCTTTMTDGVLPISHGLCQRCAAALMQEDGR